MRSQWFLASVILSVIFAQQVFAEDLQYYFNYKDTVSSIAKEYEKLQSECKTQSQEKCVDIEVHARNLLIQKATAYREYSDGVVGNFESVFPNLLTQDAQQELKEHNLSIVDARYLSSYAQVTNLPELEKILNGLLKKNAPLLSMLSATFHIHKAEELHDALLGTQKNIENEANLAEDAGMDVAVAQRNLKDAKKHLDSADNLISTTKKQFQSEKSMNVSPEVLKNIATVYADLDIATTDMLRSTQILNRFAERTSW